VDKGRNVACSVHLYCVANDQPTLQRDLMRSPEIADGSVSTSVIWGASAASTAYSDAILGADADILVFAHQDIYFPEGWFGQLLRTCETLDSLDPFWAVAGVFGAMADGRLVGHVWDSALAKVCGGPFGSPQEIASLDEVVLIVRRASGVSFDATLPSFHLYGTDIVLEARKAGLKSYVVDLPVIHNSKPVVRLDRRYVEAYRIMVAKWSAVLPWPTVIVPLTRSPLPLLLGRARCRYIAIFHPATLHPMLEYPDAKADELGFAIRGGAKQTNHRSDRLPDLSLLRPKRWRQTRARRHESLTPQRGH
jgi:hypothetical protein